MDRAKRKAYTKTSNRYDSLKDTDINSFLETLKSLKNKDFPLKQKFEDISSSLTAKELKNLKIAKLLYCLGYKKEVFLFLGIILESKLNGIVDLYRKKNWQTPNNFNNSTAQDRKFKEFVSKKSLGEKAAIVESLNLFNDQTTSGFICNKIKALSILRNYGGHSKSTNQFLENIITGRADSEIESIFSVTKDIKSGLEKLKSNPPACLP